MKIQKINIQNFRCFNELEISFAEETTIFIGKNGSGKTNLIIALKKILSFMFGQSKDYAVSLNQMNNCKVKGFSLFDSRRDFKTRRWELPIKIKASIELDNITTELTFQKTRDPGALITSLYKTALNNLLEKYSASTDDYSLPVIAFFSSSYPHIKSNIGEKAAKIIKQDLLPREFGYYGWDEDTNCAELWQRRYIKTYDSKNSFEQTIKSLEDRITALSNNNKEKNAADENSFLIQNLQEELYGLYNDIENNENLDEIRFINNRIFTFTEPVNNKTENSNPDFQIFNILVSRPDKKNNYIQFIFQNGHVCEYEFLPQGYHRLISIVFDIAYRSYILNKSEEPMGVVLIDEVELHLHPSLQQEVIQRLRKTFPKVQFVLTTHSPLIITNFKTKENENEIWNLESEKGEFYANKFQKNFYGIDYTTGLENIMGVPHRESQIDNLIDIYLVYKLSGNQVKADATLSEIEKIVGKDNHEISKEIAQKIALNS